MNGAYTPPDRQTLKSHIVQLSGVGQQYLYDVNTQLRAEGIRPSIAGPR